MGKNLLNTNYIKEATEKWLSNIVIPQVYDDSLSYYEEINKILGCLNEMGNAFETLPDAVQEILQDTGKLEVVNDVYTAIAPVEEKEYSSTNKEAGDLMWLKKDGNSTLYECLTPIDVGTIFVIGKNIQEVDINTKIKYLYEIVSNNNEHYNDRAEFTHDVNSLFIYKDQLVKANTRINIDDLLTDKYNVTSISEYVFNNFKNIETNKTDISNLKQADITLQNHIDDEISARTTDIENVNSAINTEKEARISADNAINQKLTQETTERKQEDANITTSVNEYWKTIYPVGSIYISTSTTFNPNTVWGGTWERFGQGRTLIGEGTGNDGSTSMSFTSEQTGGFYEKAISKDNIPNYMIGRIPAIVPMSHSDWDNQGVYGDNLGEITIGKFGIKPSSENRVTGDNSTEQYGWGLMTNGGNKPFNITQPYVVTYFWKRTA